MTALFTAVLNMSITASYVALAVMVIRLLFRKAPKVFSYALWLAVLLRLVSPFSFHSAFSFFSFLKTNAQASTGAMEYVPHQIGLMPTPAVDVGSGGINQVINSSLPPAEPAASVNSIQIIMEIAGMIWVVGMVILLVYGIISYLRVIHNVRTATLVKGNIFETDRIATPFLCGFIKPKIYVPVGLNDNELSYIVAHEQTHIRRRDYLIKPFAFFVLIVHWFNPVMWVSFAFMSKDMEMSCDESVIKKMGSEIKSSYSNSLLSLSLKRSSFFVGSPLAFGESHVHSRIKNVLNYKKPASGVVAAACLVILVFIVGFTANPAKKQDLSANQTEKLAAVWANALHTRDGAPRYEMMSEGMKEQFKQEQIARSGKNWNFNIGVSSPWVVDYEVKMNGRTAYITYFSKTSEPASYKTEEILTFGKENGKLVVANYQTVYEDKLMDSTDIARKIENDLEIIMSSPKTSSNPYDYIQAHRAQYDNILKMGDDALLYLNALYAKGSDQGLKGYIVKALRKDLLGESNNTADKSL